MVPVGGFEPPHPKAGDFESPMSTNSITLALLFVSLMCIQLFGRRDVLGSLYQLEPAIIYNEDLIAM